MTDTVFGVVTSMADAKRVVQELVRSGIASSSIAFTADEKQHASGLGALGALAIGAVNMAVQTGAGIAAAAAEAVRAGGVLVTVDTADPAQAEIARSVLKRHGARSYARAATEPLYTGPERRVNSAPWLGKERRQSL